MSPREKEPNQSVETQEVSPKAEIIYVAGAGEILTPSSIFKFYLHQRRGVITGQYQVIPTLVAPKSTTAKELLNISPEGPSLNHWLKLIDEIGKGEINQILHDAREDIEFADLRLQCNYMDLDKSTPDVARILSQNSLVEREKTPWASFLAIETASATRLD